MELDKIAPAFVAAQAEIGGVEKDSKNPAFKSRYASLEAVIDAAKPVLIRHKLAFMQMPGALTDHGLSVTTMILHESGQHISSTLTVPLSKRDPQGAGSAITYACRYSLMAMLGMPPVDDDGEGAMDRAPPRHEAKLAPKDGSTAPQKSLGLIPPRGAPESEMACFDIVVKAIADHKVYGEFKDWWVGYQPTAKEVFSKDYYETTLSPAIVGRLTALKEAA